MKDPGAVIEAFYAARAAGDLTHVAEFLALAGVWREPEVGNHMGTLIGAHAVIDMMRRAQHATAGTFRLRIAARLETSRHCAVHIAWSAQKDGAAIDGSELAVFAIEDGRIAQAQFFADNLTDDGRFWGETDRSPVAWPADVVLEGSYVRLEPLRLDHRDDLAEAVTDGALWRLWYVGGLAGPDGMDADIARRLRLRAAGSMLPFAVIARSSGRAIGMTTYMNIVPEHRRVEIGSTWYRGSAQRTPVNTECKLLLLAHAFEELACIAVEFRTSSFNERSRRAIERLGAKLDGVLRSHQSLGEGVLRDTYVYSITAAEWPAVRRNLCHRLDRV